MNRFIKEQNILTQRIKTSVAAMNSNVIYLSNLCLEYEEKINNAIKYIKDNDRYSNISGLYEFYGDIDELIEILGGDRDE